MGFGVFVVKQQPLLIKKKTIYVTQAEIFARQATESNSDYDCWRRLGQLNKILSESQVAFRHVTADMLHITSLCCLKSWPLSGQSCAVDHKDIKSTDV